MRVNRLFFFPHGSSKKGREWMFVFVCKQKVYSETASECTNNKHFDKLMTVHWTKLCSPQITSSNIAWSLMKLGFYRLLLCSSYFWVVFWDSFAENGISAENMRGGKPAGKLLAATLNSSKEQQSNAVFNKIGLSAKFLTVSQTKDYLEIFSGLMKT